MKKNSQLLLIVIAMLMSFVSCQDENDLGQFDEDNYKEVMKDFKMKIDDAQLPASLKNSTDAYALQAKTQFSILKESATGFSALFEIPNNAESANINDMKSINIDKNSAGKNYTWTFESTTINCSVVEQKDRYIIKYKIDSPVYSGVLMEGFIKKDNSYAELKMYSSLNKVTRLKWELNDDNYILEITSEDYSLIMNYNLKDNSGNMKQFIDGKLHSEYQWNADGSGWVKFLQPDGTYITHSWEAAEN